MVNICLSKECRGPPDSSMYEDEALTVEYVPFYPGCSTGNNEHSNMAVAYIITVRQVLDFLLFLVHALKIF